MDGALRRGHLDPRLARSLSERRRRRRRRAPGVDEHDLTEVDAPIVVLAVVGLEVLDGLGGRRRPFLVDGQVVLLGVTHRRQHVLDVQHVRAVVDTGAERAPQRRRPAEGDDRLAVDLGDDVAGFDDVADVGKAGERPLGGENERCGRAVADGPVELLGASQVAMHDLDERGRLVGARRLGIGSRRAVVADQGDAGGAGAGDGDGRAREHQPAPHPSSPSSPAAPRRRPSRPLTSALLAGRLERLVVGAGLDPFTRFGPSSPARRRRTPGRACRCRGRACTR